MRFTTAVVVLIAVATALASTDPQHPKRKGQTNKNQQEIDDDQGTLFFMRFGP